MIKCLMLPSLPSQKKHESGIRRVIEAYHKYGPAAGIEFVEEGHEHDLKVVHAGAKPGPCDVAILHGLYWTGDYNASDAEYRTNARIVESIRHARVITVPSDWVAETIRRDLRINPYIVPHGIEWQEWQPQDKRAGYILWNKNRKGVDVCDPAPVGVLATTFPRLRFKATFAPDNPPDNIEEIGGLPHPEMKNVIMGAGVYLSLTKETFCIGNLEAMASGVPILGWDNGGNKIMIEHGVNGYLARPGDYDDLSNGLEYCLKYNATLGANGREMVKQWTWQQAIEQLKLALEAACVIQEPRVDVVIPVYNKSLDELRRAVQSVADQTYSLIDQIVVVNDGSDATYNYKAELDMIISGDTPVRYYETENGGVAKARNMGISQGRAKYVCCLDSDDWLEPTFIEQCVRALESDQSLGIAFTAIKTHEPNGKERVGFWSGNADDHFAGRCTVPTCNVFRREVWQRLGGYKGRYAPHGAGSEDAELWLRMMANGVSAAMVSQEPLFNYSWLTGQVSGNRYYQEVDWREWHPWTKNNTPPFASVNTPKHLSHPVRQYDEPDISVIIPVGPDHVSLVTDALDSLEAQTFRNWEVIVVWDTGMSPDDSIAQIRKAYPYIREMYTNNEGAGVARNRGAELARGNLLFWLDADDYLLPGALSKFVAAWNANQEIVYSDYYKLIENVTEDEAKKQLKNDHLVYYDKITSRAIGKFRAFNFDCLRAIRQPEGKVPYYWCLTTTLVPKQWHNEIGGYDESMVSWEDADYAYRMARAGHCYHRVEDPIIMVRTATGSRLNKGLQIHETLVKYMSIKYQGKGDESMCSGCGGKVAVPRSVAGGLAQAANVTAIADEQMIKVRYMSTNKGRHHVFGRVINPVTGKKFFYGHRTGGEIFRVHVDDVYDRNPRTGERTLNSQFLPIEEVSSDEVHTAPVAPPPEPVAPPMPVIDQTFDLQKIPGITGPIAKQLQAMNKHTPEDILDMGLDGLMGLRGVAEKKAQMILRYIQENQVE